MALKDDLETKVADIFATEWTTRKGQVVPIPDDIKLGNDAVKLDGVVLYADLSQSTSLVDNYPAEFAAEIYKSYLHCAAKIIKDQGGVITAYDGDRIMAVFIGDNKNSAAAKAALKINYARLKIINPAIKTQYPNSTYTVRHTIGIDSCELFVARTGIRGSNDLVWVGKAANHAAKLTELPNDFPSYITEEVYDMLHLSSKYANGKLDGTNMWKKATWTTTNRTIYRSTYYWPV